MGRSQAFGGTLGSRRADGTGGTEGGLVGEGVRPAGGQCAAVQMEVCKRDGCISSINTFHLLQS